MAEKPCPRCTGQEVTFANADDIVFCHKHMGEIFKEMRDRMNELDTAIQETQQLAGMNEVGQHG